MVVKHGKHRLVGFVDLGEGHDLMTSLTGTDGYSTYSNSGHGVQQCYLHTKLNHFLDCSFTGKTEPQLATHVLQFIFLSDGSFRFPIAQFPSRECSPSDLYLNFWEGVRKMLQFRFM